MDGMIEQAMAHYNDMRVSHGDRWMVCNNTTSVWGVYEHRYAQRGVTVLI